ncbi:MAG: hypothetical protein JRH11_03525 [Deltaproteobacteria bacterium]|nr:hypothetical protein [Deltaproteobacteria bacterium]
MSGNYFDAVVLGARIGPLVCAGLLAKRGFRVLVVAGDEAPASYTVGAFQLPREPFTFLGAQTPIARRIFAELGLQQSFRRRARTIDPPFGLAMPGHRFDVPADQGALEREIEREFPNVKRPIADFFRHIEEENASLDSFFGRDLPWAAHGFMERRELARAAAHLPFDKVGENLDPLGDLPTNHPFRQAALIPVHSASHLDCHPANALMRSRLFASWRRSPAIFDGGWAGLRGLLIDKIRACGGEVREREKTSRVLTTRTTAKGVLLSNSDEPVGAGFVISGRPLSRALRLFEDRRSFEHIFETHGEPRARFYRYTLNVVLPREAVPSGLARDTFYLRSCDNELWGDNLLRIQRTDVGSDAHRALVVEALLPRRGVEEVSGYLDGAREHIISSLSDLMPFMREACVLVDSPHDGRPPSGPDGEDLEVEEPWARGPRSMRAIHGYPVPGTLGIGGLPQKTPVRRFLVCSEQVLPGLGEEGELLTAWSAARFVTRADKRKERMRRGLWTKAEL